MNRTSTSARTVLSLSALALLITSGILYAGPLNPPPGPVTSTYKTLTEVEPRIAINLTNTPGDADSLFKITQPGSYYLTGNIAGVVGKHGIEIATSGVTLDLNGFDLVGVTGSLDGVSVTASSLTSIAVVNGTVRNWGDEGVDLVTQIATNCRVEGVLASGNGGTGISVGYGSTVSNSSADSNTANGIATATGCTVSNCSAYDNTASGIATGNGCTVSNCSAYGNGGNGIGIGAGSILNCSARFNRSHGISASDGGSITGCTSTGNSFDGIRVTSGCRVADNTCSFNGFVGLYSGIFVTGNKNVIEGNHVTDNDAGISGNAGITGNTMIGNTAAGNTTNYSLPAAGNIIGTVVTTSAAMNAATNSNVNISQ